MARVFTLFAFLLAASTAFAQNDPGVDFFERKIRPVLVQQCYECHSSQVKEPKGGLLLDTREGIRRGGESGRAVVPKSLADSLIMEALRREGLEMPPEKQLPDQIIADFEKWISMGAPDPRDGKSIAVRRKIDFEQARTFWAFQPIQNPAVPTVKSDVSRTDIDRFVLAKLEAKGLQPVGQASPRTLVRRIYFDLIGLPPSPAQIESFLEAAEKDQDTAIESLIDQLLASKQFGERWGRHWLDVVRYGESTGMERNYTFTHAWRYRDYIIDAFNSDVPYDRFIHEQVAGDLLDAKDSDEKLRLLTATGVLAMGPKSLNERNAEKFKMDIVDEQIDVTSRAFFGLTASCARCHDHKFDPIPQSEYYALAGVFRSTDTYYGTGGGAGNRQAGMLLGVSKDGVKPVPTAAGGGKKKAANGKKQLKAVQVRIANFKRQVANAKNDKAKVKFEAQLKRLEAQLAKLKKQAAPEPAPKPTKPTAKPELVMAVQDASKPADTQLRIRGEANDRGDMVPRGFLTIATLGEKPGFDGSKSGRLQYAKWLTDPSNPLTARVAVNRIWQHLFGRGIVQTVNNFGQNGERPTHPELLDWLATQFVNDGWSVKQTIKSIMLSRVYQLGSETNPKAAKVDSENLLLWRANHRRLEVESIRDAILAASGQLDLKPGEKSVVLTVGNGDIGRNLDVSRFQTVSRKRSVYLPIVRGAVPEMLQVFDFPEPSIIAGQRDQTTVPTQALYMMNSDFVIQQAGHLANRLLSEAGMGDDERLDLAYQLAFGRLPTEKESSRSLEFLADARAALGGKDVETRAWTGLAQALFASAEFRYIE